MQQDKRVIQFGSHFVSICDEVRRQVTAVKLHAFNNIQLAVEAFGFFNCDNAFIADLLHGFGNHVTDGNLTIGRNSANLCDLFITFNFLGTFFQIAKSNFDSFVNTALEIHWVHSGGN